MKKYCLVVAFAGLLTACANYHDDVYFFAEDSLELEVLETIEVPAGSSYVYILNGQAVNKADIGSFDDYCKFTLPRPKQSDQLLIQPGKFAIPNTYQRVAATPIHFDTPVEVASLDVASSSLSSSGGMSRRELTLLFVLQSDNQSHIESLSCIRYADPLPKNRISLTDAQRILGSLAKISPRSVQR